MVSLSSGQVRTNIFKDSLSKYLDSTSLLQLNQWAHAAVSVNGSNGYIYIKGILSGQITGLFFLDYTHFKIVSFLEFFVYLLKGIAYNAVQRNSAYIGKTTISTDPLMSGVIDDFKIFSRALN